MAAAPPAAAYCRPGARAHPRVRSGRDDRHSPSRRHSPPRDPRSPTSSCTRGPPATCATRPARSSKALLAERAASGLSTPRLLERDIETDPAWQRAYFTTIPVVEFAGRRLELATSAAKLRALLHDVLDA